METIDILVFKTNILVQDEVSLVKQYLHAHSLILACNVDLDDCDKVLRIESSGVRPGQIIDQVTTLGFHCEELLD